MWRWIVLALVLANGTFWLWRHGELRPWGFGPLQASEPGRLKTQIQPESLRVTPQEPATEYPPQPAPNPSSAQGK